MQLNDFIGKENRTKLKTYIGYSLMTIAISLIFRDFIYHNFIDCLLKEFSKPEGCTYYNIGFCIIYGDLPTLIAINILSILFIIWSYKTFYEYVKNHKLFNLILILGLVYFTTRLFYLFKTNIDNIILYPVDILVPTIWIIIFYLRFNGYKHITLNRKNESKLFIQEIPIDKIIDYEQIAELAAKRCNGYFGPAFVMSFTGAYGQGKTTLMNRINEKLDIDLIKSSNFVPARYNNNENLIKDFFTTFKDAIEPYDSGISKAIYKYTSLLFSETNNSLVKATIDFLSIKENTEEERIKINQIIRNTEKTFVFFIDDLDRLDKGEIHTVFKLIRNVADFENVIFITAYDVKKILEHAEIDLDYLEKYSNLTVALPKRENYTIDSYIYQLFAKEGLFIKSFSQYNNKRIIDFIKKPLDNYIYKKNDLDSHSDYGMSTPRNVQSFFSDVIILDFIKNYREANSFFNSFLFSYELMSKNNTFFNPHEYLVYKLLVSKFPWMQGIIGSALEQDTSAKFLNTFLNGKNKQAPDISYTITHQILRTEKPEKEITEIKAKEDQNNPKLYGQDFKKDFLFETIYYNIVNNDFEILNEKNRDIIDKSIRFLFSKVDEEVLNRLNPYSIRRSSFFKIYESDNVLGFFSISDLFKAIEVNKLDDFFKKIEEIYDTDLITLSQVYSDYASLVLSYTELPDSLDPYTFYTNINNSLNKSHLSQSLYFDEKYLDLATKLVEKYKLFEFSIKIFRFIESTYNHQSFQRIWYNDQFIGKIIKLLNRLFLLHFNEFRAILIEFLITSSDNIYLFSISEYYTRKDEGKFEPLEIYAQQVEQINLTRVFCDRLNYLIEKGRKEEIFDTAISLRKKFSFNYSERYLPFEFRSILRQYIEGNLAELIDDFAYKNKDLPDKNLAGIEINSQFSLKIYIPALDLHIFCPEEFDNCSHSEYTKYYMQGVAEYKRLLNETKLKSSEPNKIDYIIKIVDFITLVDSDRSLEALNAIRKTYGYSKIEIER